MTDIKPSMLDVHSQALEDVDEAYHEFLLIYRKGAQCVYGFVEGKDDPVFYRHLIENELPKGWSIKLIPSGNKQKVLRAFQSINWIDYYKKRVCFFIDRDLQDFVGSPQQAEPNIYITDGYSIENSILHSRVLIGMLADIYQITLLNPEEEELIKEIIQKNENAFFDAIMPLMGQILLWRQSGSKANLSNLRLDHIFSFSEANFVPKKRNALLKMSANQIGCDLCDDSDITEAERVIRCHPSSYMMVRGKYVLWFFVKQCEVIWQAIPNLLSRFQRKPRKRTECGLHNAMVILGPRARAPESLKEFIRRNYLSFISEIGNS